MFFEIGKSEFSRHGSEKHVSISVEIPWQNWHGQVRRRCRSPSPQSTSHFDQLSHSLKTHFSSKSSNSKKCLSLSDAVIDPKVLINSYC